MTHCKAKIIVNEIERVTFMEILWFFISTQLAYCIVQFLEKDPGLTEPVRLMIQLNPVLRQRCYYSHFILAQTKAQSVTFLFKLTTNRWAWELVPKRLTGSRSHKPRGGIHGNPGSGNHPHTQPLTGTVTLSNQWKQLTWLHTYLEITKEAGGMGRGKNPQRFANREESIRKDQQATMHEKGNTTWKPCKSPKNHPAGHVLKREKLLTALVESNLA